MVQTSGAVTVTLAVAVGLFVPSEAVSVYVVVEAGETLCVPEATGLTDPTLWSIEVLVQFEVAHDRTDVPPVAMDAGAAVKEVIVQGGVQVRFTVTLGLFGKPFAVSVTLVGAFTQPAGMVIEI